MLRTAGLQLVVRDLLADAPTGTQPEVAIRQVAHGYGGPRLSSFDCTEWQEVIRDLLADTPSGGMQPEVAIREVAGGGVCLAGAREIEVRLWFQEQNKTK